MHIILGWQCFLAHDLTPYYFLGHEINNPNVTTPCYTLGFLKKHYTACESMSLEEHALKAAQEAAESQAAAADDPRSHGWYWYLSLFTKCFNGAELGNSPPQQSVL
jgi:hypothetical protein